MKLFPLKVVFCFLIVLVLPLSGLASTPTTDNSSTPEIESDSTNVIFDNDTGLISIKAKGARLGEVMDRIAESTKLIVKTMNEEFREDVVDVELNSVSVKQAVDRLLSGVNAIYFYATPYGANDEPLEPQLSKVMVLSRKQAPDATPQVIRNPQEEELADAKPSGRPRELVKDKSKDVITAVLNGKLTARQRAVENLKNDGTVQEKMKTVAGLGDLVMTPSEYNSPENGHVFYESLEALKELDPESGETFLASLLESAEEPWAQSLAAENLGEWNAKFATDSLLSAFKSRYPLVRQSATESLAKIGDTRGITQLIQAAQDADPQFQQMIASAIASSGNEASQAALNQAINESLIAEAAIVDPPFVEGASQDPVPEEGTQSSQGSDQ